MKKGTWLAFILSFLFSFLVYGFFSGTLLPLPSLPKLEFSTILELFLLISIASTLLALAVAFSVSQTKHSDELTTIGNDLTEGANNFSKALVLVRTKAFYPLWIAFALICSGYFLIASKTTILGGILVFAGQVKWFTSRQSLLKFIDSKNVALQAEEPLRWIIRLMDAFALLVTLAVITALTIYAKILQPTKMLGLSFVISIFLTIVWHRANQLRFDMLFGIKVMIAFAWVLLISMTINYGLDYREATNMHTISYRDCPDRKNFSFTNGKEKFTADGPEDRFIGCKIFYSMASPNLEDKAVTSYHPGALGIAWRKIQLIPGAQ